MSQKLFLTVCLTFVFAFSYVHCSNAVLDAKIQVTSVQNLTQFELENPEAKLFKDYALGNRVNGDSLRATEIDWTSYSSPQDVKLTLTFNGAIITYVQILVEQSTNIGRAYVEQGGLGQREIIVNVEASNTLYFRYKAYFYGY